MTASATASTTALIIRIDGRIDERLIPASHSDHRLASEELGYRNATALELAPGLHMAVDGRGFTANPKATPLARRYGYTRGSYYGRAVVWGTHLDVDRIRALLDDNATDPLQSPIVTVNGVRYCIRDLECGSFLVGQEFTNRREWIDPHWTWIGGPFATRHEALAALPRA